MKLAVGLIALLLAVTACSAPPDDGPATARAVELRANRLYDGAPPVIPHAVGGLGREACLACHLKGDATDANGNVATRTPHPELENCVQCHVERLTGETFVDNDFEGRPWATGERQHGMSPWRIPHPLTLRENCLACHDGVGIPEKARTTHPERENCVQCHMPAHPHWPGPRPNEVPAAPR